MSFMIVLHKVKWIGIMPLYIVNIKNKRQFKKKVLVFSLIIW